ncbi:kinase-like domain-containing protein [Mycena metata]|uniref:Kinase-like domain-containing protein n=1 Tax=Mycena metata TaxID=1033252 RepID=A0AAD7JRZ9_9AGAR|nr:kinase-like domain-containing protein [Mycena metata]
MLGNLGNTSPVPPALEVNPSDHDATGAVDLETPEEDDDALYELPPMVVFQEVDPGYYHNSSGRWRKTATPPELHVYKTIQHQRILRYYGTTRGGELELEFHPTGDLWTYLVEARPSLATRIEWAVQIAEGLAELHSHSIIWADPHFRNILVTADLNIVLCDFAFSLSSPPQFLQFSTRPPQIFVAPFGFFGYDPTYVDIFGYGVMLFALLANRFPWTHDLVPCYELHLAATEKHDRFEFDSLNNTELEAHFSSVINKCFLATYATGMELLDGVKNARDSWLSVSALVLCQLNLTFQ